MNNLGMGIKGVIIIREFSKETGELVGEYTDENVVTELGINTLFLRMTLSDDPNIMRFDHFTLGNDDGSAEEPGAGWAPLNPKPALKRYTTLNQYTVYDVPYGDMVFDYPNTNEMQAATLLDGNYILDSFFPDQVDMVYTSATLRFRNNTTFAYKRFPARSLSRLIDVQIIWTFKIVNEYDYVCPVPPSMAEKRLYVASDDLFYGLLDDSKVLQETTVSGLTNINHVKTLNDGTVYLIKDNKRLIISDESGSVSTNRVLNISRPVTALDVDQNGVVYVGTQEGKVVKVNNSGGKIWTKNLAADGKNKEVSSIWVINTSRIGVSTKDTTDESPNTSGNMIHVLSATDGEIIYTTSIADSSNKTGYVTFISSSGGEYFAIQKAKNTGDDNALLKLAFDLSEIDRVNLLGETLDIYADHDNELIVSYIDSGSVVERRDADLNYIWKYTDSDNSGYKYIVVDKNKYIYAVMDSKITTLNSELDRIDVSGIPSSRDASVVSEKWSYFS